MHPAKLVLLGQTKGLINAYCVGRISEGLAVGIAIGVPDYSSCFVHVGIRTVNYHFFCLLPEAIPYRTD